MPAYRGMARNADPTQIVKLCGGKATGLYLPSGITVSAGPNVNGWNDASGAGNNLSLGAGNPQKSVFNGCLDAVTFNGTTDYLKSAANFLAYFGVPGSQWHTMALVKQLGAGGGSTTAGNYYTNPGFAGDSAQFWNTLQCVTTGGVDSVRTEIYYTGAGFEDLTANTTSPGSTTRTPMLIESWLQTDKIARTRVKDLAIQASAANVTGLGNYGGNLYVGRSGTAFLNCQVAALLVCNAALSVVEQANVRKWFGRMGSVLW